MSKNGCYENPCVLTDGTVMYDQIQAQRDDLKMSNDRNIGTRKTGDAEAVAGRRCGKWEYLHKRAITIFHPGESSGTVPMKP